MTTPLQKCINTTSETALQMSAGAVVGYLCARAFTVINPVHGAVFCAATTIVSKLITPVFEGVFSRPGANEASKLLGGIFSTGAGIAASAALSTAAGFQITFASGLVLLCSILAVKILAVLGLAVATAIAAS